MTHKKTAIVTGGGSGLGLAIAKQFIDKGINVVIVGRNSERLSDARKALGEFCSYEVCDLSDLNAIPSLINTVEKKNNRIDILVNNAGIHLKKPLIEVSDEEYQQVILTNQKSVFSISREVAKHMIDQGSGVILNISSMASQYGIPNVIAYTAAKSAIEGMTRAMAVELSPIGIRVNCIAPGFIYTDMSSKALNDDPVRKAKVIGRTPLGKLGQPKDVAQAAYFLCSDESEFITGAILPVDGGNSIGF
jgi:NAD(P)-dependent dehydrogenase (short-subunit alcohol dehydrogenase family)